MNTVEGRLDIVWENGAQPTATPQYALLFVRNTGGGALRPKRIVSTDGLKSYLIELGFSSDNATHWIEQVHGQGSVSIPNVVLAEPQLEPYIARPA